MRFGHIFASNLVKFQPIFNILSLLEIVKLPNKNPVTSPATLAALPWEMLELHLHVVLQKMLLNSVSSVLNMAE